MHSRLSFCFAVGVALFVPTSVHHGGFAADLAPLPVMLPMPGYEGTPKDMPPDTTAEKPTGNLDHRSWRRRA